ncbi:MAG TPA: hypothetical protein VLY24_20380 [Bryobacteraceae bacterium]|nr:hypothetical protein [Bryobacteraceae bacterium]
MASKVQAHLTKHDREIAAIRKLILMGMKMIVKNDQRYQQHFLRLEGAQFEVRQDLRALATEGRETRRELRALQAEVRALTADQRQLQKTVDTFVRSMGGRGGNGRHQ